jgi:hypothetical protein
MVHFKTSPVLPDGVCMLRYSETSMELKTMHHRASICPALIPFRKLKIFPNKYKLLYSLIFLCPFTLNPESRTRVDNALRLDPKLG